MNKCFGLKKPVHQVALTARSRRYGLFIGASSGVANFVSETVNLFTLMNTALGPLIRRLGFLPNRRVNRPKKTPAEEPARFWKEDGADNSACRVVKVSRRVNTRGRGDTARAMRAGEERFW
jgi:hypothetical protein